MKITCRRDINRPLERLRLPALLAVAALFVAACASTPVPTPEVAVSAAAVSHAAAAGGPEFAPNEMKSARDKLDRANAALTAKDYDQARSLAEEAQVDAQLAEAKAHSAKAHKAADELREDSRVLREEINRKSK